ncbi:hypothetical protein JQC72_11625 [Polycladomyces sp. WAk]|uniref:Uncharacterized protein n=1 Tax=Polycladomyces zharkentensis TaxID=2807616 RepID=A0ABS2WKZ7_9BACL|nr:hypothetical protein [Polycladomyces sp. WAk]MBN2910151.1 hypothetical protein [Polycladomyces sp. WAk]
MKIWGIGFPGDGALLTGGVNQQRMHDKLTDRLFIHQSVHIDNSDVDLRFFSHFGKSDHQVRTVAELLSQLVDVGFQLLIQPRILRDGHIRMGIWPAILFSS